METIRKEFRFVFKNIMDRDHFEDNIYFRDPITTNLNSFRGALCQSVLALWCASTDGVAGKIEHALLIQC